MSVRSPPNGHVGKRGPRPRPFSLRPGHGGFLRMIVRNNHLGSRVELRAKLLLLLEEGYGPTAAAATLTCDRSTVWHVRDRYERLGMAAVHEPTRRGSGRRRNW